MARVADRHPGGVTIDTHELTGDEVAHAGVLEERVVGRGGLLQEPQLAATAVAQAADEHGGERGRVHVVPDGVGDRDVQGVAVEVVVERVAATALVGSSQPDTVSWPALRT
jgi:hypothetical protein